MKKGKFADRFRVRAVANLKTEIAIIEDLLFRMRGMLLNESQKDFYNRKCETLGAYKNELQRLTKESEVNHV